MHETPFESTDRIATEQGEIGFPVAVYYIELAKLYMSKIRWQWHDEIEIFIVKDGQADLFTDNQKIRLFPGDGIIINQNVMHALQPANDSTECSVYSIAFHPSFLFGYGDTVLSTKYLLPLITSPNMRILELRKHDPVHAKMLKLADNIIACSTEKKYGYEMILKSYLCHLWVMILENITPKPITKQKETTISMDESRVKDAIIYIENHFHEQITLEQLADSIHISKSECCRCFKRTLQLTPFEYLMKYRIMRAIGLIQSNAPDAHSMSTLALSVGFNNASYFNKVFKQVLGCTPSEYKRKIKNDPTLSAGPFLSL